jgi:hypothetical protein
VSDNESPAQTANATESITISTAALTIATPGLPGAQDGSAYSATLQASGGTPAYTWSIQSGSLPAGLTLGATTGVISGTPTSTGNSNFTIAVTDNSSPAQTRTVSASIAVSPQTPLNGNTWYVRMDGGTRYSVNVTSGQCDGLADAPYPGSGVNQHCAFNDARFLIQDGSWANGDSSFPAWGWIGAGGDTYIIRGSIADGVSYRIGWNNSSSAYDSTVGRYFGLAGNPYASGIPAPPSGTASQHTRVLGGNYGSCHAASAKTQLHGGYDVSSVLTMKGAKYVDVACLDITDFSSCGKDGQTNQCNTTPGSLTDNADVGIVWYSTSTYDSLTDIHIHGMSSVGMAGPTGTGVTMDYVDVIGNAGAGWNADPGDGTTGVGTLSVTHFNISWNGCAEEYPMVDAVPYQDCTDDGSDGYGDGFGTATVASPSPGWQVVFDQGVASYNTQDGLDALHLTGTGSSMTVTRTLAYGNMGQQIKVGGAQGTAISNVIVGSCNALRNAIPGTPSGYNSKLSDFCRAADTALVMSFGKGSTTVYQFNTIYAANSTAVEFNCDTTGGACDSTSLVDFRNNIFLGFLNNTANGYPSGSTGDYSSPIYVSGSVNPFRNPGSLNENNVTYRPKSNWTCPSSYLEEASAGCGDPGLTDETWHVYGYPDATPVSGTGDVIGAGVAIPGVTLDYNGQTRSIPPSIGAIEP